MENIIDSVQCARPNRLVADVATHKAHDGRYCGRSLEPMDARFQVVEYHNLEVLT
jgi:hypothetical protein